MDAPGGRRRGKASFFLTLLDLDEDMVARRGMDAATARVQEGGGRLQRVVEREGARPPCVVERARHLSAAEEDFSPGYPSDLLL
jgi:hypothetical protein